MKKQVQGDPKEIVENNGNAIQRLVSDLNYKAGISEIKAIQIL